MREGRTLTRLIQLGIAGGVALVMVATFVAVGGLGSGMASAEETRPGNGCGDRNHVHTGPPGQGMRSCRNQSATGTTTTGTTTTGTTTTGTTTGTTTTGTTTDAGEGRPR